MPSVVLPVASFETIANRVAGLRVVLRVKQLVCIDGLCTAVGKEAHGKRFRVFSRAGTYQDARTNRGPENGWTLVYDDVLCVEAHSPGPFRRLCKGLELSLGLGWHTLYLHGECSNTDTK